MKSKMMAMGGVMAALAVVIMCMGGLIPVATFVCPLICCLILQFISGMLKTRMCWVWYAVVSVLSLLLGPDKEAAAVFVFLGYYPIIRPLFPKKFWGWILKFLYFNVSILAMYWILIHFLGVDQIVQDYAEFRGAMGAILILLGNVTFFLLDRLLALAKRRFP